MKTEKDRTTNKSFTKLLMHDSTMKSYGNTQDAHPHPIFSCDDKSIFFVSDKDGLPGIYRSSIELFTSKEKKLKLLQDSFKPFLYKSNAHVVKSLRALGMDQDKIRQTEMFDWFQGVGLYGYYECFKVSGNPELLSNILDYFDTRISDGLPEKNINSMAPMLTMVHMLDDKVVPENRIDLYNRLVLEWSSWLIDRHPRTEEGGFSHLTCEAENSQELWDDSLFMSVLFLGKTGVYLDRKDFIDEAVYQFLLHQYYLLDPSTGLWFHGWTFDGNHHFAEALWNRGNSWITIFVPLFLELLKDYLLDEASKKMLINGFNQHVDALLNVELKDGLLPTLLNDINSYGEASGSAGILFGIKKGLKLGIYTGDVDKINLFCGQIEEKILSLVDESGILCQVSGGTAMGKESLDYYRNIPIEPKPYGQAMAMLALNM